MDAPKKKRKSVYNEYKKTYTNQYVRENYDRIELNLLKSGDVNKETLRAAAAAAGESINAYVAEAVRRRIESEKAK